MDVATRSKIRKPFITLITPLAAASQEAFNNLHYACTSSGSAQGERRFVNYTWPRWVESAPQERLCIDRPQAWTHDPLGEGRNVAHFPGCSTWLHPNRLGLPRSNSEVRNHLAMNRGKGDTSSLEICAVLVVSRVNTTPEELISVGFRGCAKPWKRGGVLLKSPCGVSHSVSIHR